MKFYEYMERTVSLITVGIVACVAVIFISLVIGHAVYGDAKGYYRTRNLPAYSPDYTSYPDKYPPLIHLELTGGNACTAFVIDSHYAVTAGHCLYESSKHNFIQNMARSLTKAIPVLTVGYNMRVDYGLIMGDFHDFNNPKIATNAPVGLLTEGHQLVVCGFPQGQTAPLCIPLMSLGPSNFMIIAKGEAYPGMSGGPVFEPNTGIAIGLIQAVGATDAVPGMVIVSPLVGFLSAMGIEP